MDHLRSKDHERSLIASHTSIAPETALQQLQKQPDESERAFARRVVDILHRSIAHVYDDERASEHRWHVPPEENIVLWLGGFLSPRVKKYAFCDHERAIWRGMGLCGQQARAVTSVLRDEEICASPVAFDDHVIVEATVDGEQWIFDSDLNVIIPHSIEECRDDPSLARPYYADAETIGRGGLSDEYIDHIVNIFRTDPGTLTPSYDIQQWFEKKSYTIHRLARYARSVL